VKRDFIIRKVVVQLRRPGHNYSGLEFIVGHIERSAGNVTSQASALLAPLAVENGKKTGRVTVSVTFGHVAP